MYCESLDRNSSSALRFPLHSAVISRCFHLPVVCSSHRSCHFSEVTVLLPSVNFVFLLATADSLDNSTPSFIITILPFFRTLVGRLVDYQLTLISVLYDMKIMFCETILSAVHLCTDVISFESYVFPLPLPILVLCTRDWTGPR